VAGMTDQDHQPDTAARPTPRDMAHAIEYLADRVDEIVGSPLEIAGLGKIYLHTDRQIEDWLREKFTEVVNGD
jgi:hypothetical protein